MRRRRLLLLLAAFFAAVALAIMSLPWWLGLALRAVPERTGLTYGSYERIGYARFALSEVDYRRRNVRVTATRIEMDTPVLWSWRTWRGHARKVVVGNWRVDVDPPASVTPRTIDSGWIRLRTQLRRVADQLDRWLPDARAGSGVVRWPRGELTVASASWSQRALDVKTLAFRGQTADAHAALPASPDEVEIELRLAGSTNGLRVVSRGADVEGRLMWWDQTATVAARYAPAGWVPETAALRADNWTLAGERLKMGEQYSMVRGRGLVEWREGKFQVEVAASGEPAVGKKAPPLDVDVRGRGDLEAFTVEALRATVPGIRAILSEPVTVTRAGQLRDSAATFRLDVDFAQQPWFDAQGVARGEARVITRQGGAPAVDFRWEAQDVGALGISISSLVLPGRLEWPRVSVRGATLIGAMGERLEISGGWDFRSREILAATVNGTLRRNTLARWLPAQPEFESVDVRAEAAGPSRALRHAGSVAIASLTVPGMKPLRAEATWRGQGDVIENMTVDAGAAATRLRVTASANREAVRLTELELAQGGAMRVRLQEPATFRWKPSLQITDLHLAGPEGAIDAALTWGETGRIDFALRNVPSSWLADLVTLPGPAWQVTWLAVTGAWDHGPMMFSTVLGAQLQLGSGRSATVSLAGRGNENGLQIEALRAAEGADAIINAEGSLPIVLFPGRTPLVKIDPDAAVALNAATAPNAAFWQELATLTGFELKQPRMDARVRGTWRRPEGAVLLEAERIAVDPKRFSRPLPTIEALDVALHGRNDGILLERFALQVQGQSLRASGRLPMAERDWSALFKEPLAFARRGADVRLEIPDADVSAFTAHLPAVLAPKGRLHLDVRYQGGALDGNLRLTDAATRPIGPLGVLQEIEADLRLAGQTLEFRSVSAKSGGESVQLTGRIEMPGLNLSAAQAAAPDKQPRFDLALAGRNLPFARSTGLLVRGDLDLRLNSDAAGIERVSGTVKLRESLFLLDVRGLLPGGAASKARRPPYFAVETAPLSDWRLDVSLEGEQFMRLRTPLFNGIASARLHLGGTLGEPLAIGDVVIDEGRVRLPFAMFEVQDGRVMLTREQPYEPQLFVTATARRFGYDLRMEVTGQAAAPVLAFSSSPPLEHGQILLMVMAGESPKQEVTFTDQQRARKLGTFLGQSLLASFGGESENADRLSISSGEKVSRQGRETYDLEYRLNERWSVIGEYDEFDEYNAGIKWRVYEREGPPAGAATDEKKP